jgi:hypothetical protein
MRFQRWRKIKKKVLDNTPQELDSSKQNILYVTVKNNTEWQFFAYILGNTKSTVSKMDYQGSYTKKFDSIHQVKEHLKHIKQFPETENQLLNNTLKTNFQQYPTEIVFQVNSSFNQDIDFPPVVTESSQLKTLRKLFFHTNRKFKDTLNQSEYTISVAGSRGKSSAVKLIEENFLKLGFNTLSKITGINPKLRLNGVEIDIERQEPRVTLYENITVLEDFLEFLTLCSKPFVVITENQALTEYTMDLFNNRFFQSDIVFITNVRKDHRDTLGKTRGKIAHSFVTSLPDESIIINCDQNEKVSKFIKENVSKNCTFKQTTVPEKHQSEIASETIYGVKTLFQLIQDKQIVTEAEINKFLDEINPQWKQNGDARIFNASAVNDIESTELIRSKLMEQINEKKITVFIFLRNDRRSRTDSFIVYLNNLYEKGFITEPVYFSKDTKIVVDSFSRRLQPETKYYSSDTVTATELLECFKEQEYPVLIVGNTVHPLMKQLREKIEQRPVIQN